MIQSKDQFNVLIGSVVSVVASAFPFVYVAFAVYATFRAIQQARRQNGEYYGAGWRDIAVIMWFAFIVIGGILWYIALPEHALPR